VGLGGGGVEKRVSEELKKEDFAQAWRRFLREDFIHCEEDKNGIPLNGIPLCVKLNLFLMISSLKKYSHCKGKGVCLILLTQLFLFTG